MNPARQSVSRNPRLLNHAVSLLVTLSIILSIGSIVPGGVEGAVAGSPASVSGYPLAGSYALDLGSGSAYVTFGDPAKLDLAQFTIETWFKRTGAGKNSNTGTDGIPTAIPLVTHGAPQADGSNLDANWILAIYETNDVIAADFEDAASGGNHPVYGVTPITDNVWHHAAATYDGATWQLYLDGKLERTAFVGASPRSDTIQHAGLGTMLSSGGGTSGHFQGVLDEARVWNVARTQAQIVADINRELTSGTGLVARWGLDEGSGSAVADSIDTPSAANGTINHSGYAWVAGAPFDIAASVPPDAPTLVAPADGSTGVGVQPKLQVGVSDPESAPLTVTFYGRRADDLASEPFTFAAISDTQYYTSTEEGAAIYRAQMQWLVNQKGALNVAFASHVGDLTESGDVPEEWARASAAQAILDSGGVPNGVVPGDHDMGLSDFASYDPSFPTSRYEGFPWYGSYLGDSTDGINDFGVDRKNKDSYSLLSIGGMDFIVLHLEVEPPQYAIDWANAVLDTYSNRRAIVVTHEFVSSGGGRSSLASLRPVDGKSPAYVWQSLIYPNCNVFMVLNGHAWGEVARTDPNVCGQPVHQILQNYQGRANGGNGWLRYYAFKPNEDKIEAYTYSPTLNLFETDGNSRFDLSYDMEVGAAFQVIGTATVSSGSTASAVWNGLAIGKPYEWYVTVSDGQSVTTSPVWSFSTTTSPNRAPVANDGSVTVNEDASNDVTLSATDADGDALTYTVVSRPAYGSLSGTAPDLTYTPAANYNGSDSFTFKAYDGTAYSNTATISITVSPANDAPIVSDLSVSTDEDTARALPLAGFDIDGDSLTFAVASQPTHGSLTGTAPDLTYTPAANYNGPDSFTYTANDGTVSSPPATVSIAVLPINDAPTAVGDSYNTEEGVALTVTAPGVLANDSDVEGSALSAPLASNPTHGTMTLSQDGSFTYTPNADFRGTDSFTYRASDGDKTSAVATVTIEVTPANGAPGVRLYLPMVSSLR